MACLLSVLRSFGGNLPLSTLREWSGTTVTGTTMLGLYQAARKLGMDAQGFEADIEHLKNLSQPAILHVQTREGLLHYVVCFAYHTDLDRFEISDPAEYGIKFYSSKDLEALWQSKALLLLKPTPEIKKVARNDSFLQKMRWLYGFARPDFDLLLVSFFIGVFISLLGLSVAIFSQKLIDQILPEKNLARLFAGSGLLLFLLLLRSGIGYIRQLFLLRQTRDFNVRIIRFFYSSLLNLPKPFFDTRKTGELISRMNDTARIQQTVSNVFTSFTIEAVVILITTVALMFYHLQLGLLSLLWLPVFGFIVYRYNKPLIEGQRKVMSTYALNESNYIDTIQGVGVIKMANAEARFTEQTLGVYRVFQEKRFELGQLANRFGTFSQMAGSVFIVGLIVFSSILVLRESISIGTVMAVIQLIGMAMASASSIALINIVLQEAKVALDRMQEFTALPPEFDPMEESGKRNILSFNSISVKDLDFRFIGRPLLLDQLSFEVHKGEIIAILGESGSGKSTLLQIIQRFYQPENGTILVNGLPMNEYSIPEWRKITGVVPQDVKLFNASLLENILLRPVEETDVEPLTAFFEKYGFDKHFTKLPGGYHTLLGEEGINISGGQQQLVALARALFPKPQLLLLDEATSAMDRFTEQTILNLLQSIRPHTATIIITHRPKTASIADRIYILENGRFSISGSPAELLMSKNFYSEALA